MVKTYILFLILFYKSILCYRTSNNITLTTEISIQETEEKFIRKKIHLLKDSESMAYFLPNKEFKTCQNPPSFKETLSTNLRVFTLTASKPIQVALTATLRPYDSDRKHLLSVEPSVLDLQADQSQEFVIHYSCAQITQTHAFVTLEVGDIATLEFLKVCNPVPDSQMHYLLSSSCLLVMAVIVISIGVKQDQFAFIRNSGEAELYEVESLSLTQTLGILLFASSVLLGFYIMIKFFSLIWLITILFLFSMSSLMIPFFMEAMTSLAKGNVLSICNLSCINGMISVKLVISVLITGTLVGTWYITRNWVANNLIGCIAVLVFLKMLRLNKLMPGLAVLSALFLYDIFWVFFSPYIFHGESVMVVVATNVDLPAKLVFPSWNVFTSCSLIGLGDLAVPGFYIGYVTRFGDYMRTNLYYLCHIIAYILSIIVCIYVVSLGYGGQPALLYIVPALFITTFTLGVLRGEVNDLFEGLPTTYAINRPTIDYADSSLEHENEFRTFQTREER